MANETTTQIVKEDPRVEAYRLGLLQDVKDLVSARVTDPNAMPPAYKVAGLSGLEDMAATLGQAGIGAYVPYLQGAANQVGAGQDLVASAAVPTLGQGQQYLQEAGRLAQQLREIPYQYQTAAGEGMLASAGTFDPSTQVSSFENPYEDAVVQQTLQDIQDQGDVQLQQQRANAVASGAFGGSRSGIMDSELAANILREQGRAAGNLRQQGYESARNAAQQAFENTQQRRLAASQGIGDLGINYGQLSQADIGQMQGIGQGLGSLAGQYAALGSQAANLGLQQAGLGEMAQRSNLSDIQTLTALGAMQRGQQQAELDAQRRTRMDQLAAPYQQLGFLSDVYRGTPTSQATITQQGGGQSPSTAQQVLGLGIAGLGAVQGARTMGLGF
tara:strand:+ start:213 stop:1373 length:1161 start_codon:yes stop_codon:yes gene_type:complete